VNPQSCFSKDSIKGKPVLEKKSHPMKKEEGKRKDTSVFGSYAKMSHMDWKNITLPLYHARSGTLSQLAMSWSERVYWWPRKVPGPYSAEMRSWKRERSVQRIYLPCADGWDMCGAYRFVAQVTGQLLQLFTQVHKHCGLTERGLHLMASSFAVGWGPNPLRSLWFTWTKFRSWFGSWIIYSG